MDYYLTVRDIDRFDDLAIREIDRFDEVRIGLNGNQIVRLNTTVDDGSLDVVRIVSEKIKSDVATVAEKYGKYVVYGVAGLIVFQLGKLWWRYRKKRG